MYACLENIYACTLATIYAGSENITFYASMIEIIYANLENI